MSKLKCYNCGETIEGHQVVCPNCGRVQTRSNYLKQNDKDPIYTTLKKVADAMTSGENKFFAIGKEMQYKPENYKKYLKAICLPIILITIFWIFICYKYSIGLWGYISLPIFLCVISIWSYLKRTKQSLFINLVSEGYLQMGPKSPLNQYHIKYVTNEKYLIERSWMAKNPKYVRILSFFVVITIIVTIILLLFFGH